MYFHTYIQYATSYEDKAYSIFFQVVWAPLLVCDKYYTLILA